MKKLKKLALYIGLGTYSIVGVLISIASVLGIMGLWPSMMGSLLLFCIFTILILFMFICLIALGYLTLNLLLSVAGIDLDAILKSFD